MEEQNNSKYNMYDNIVNDIYIYIYGYARRHEGYIRLNKFKRNNDVYKVFLSVAELVSQTNGLPIQLPINIFEYLFHHKFYKLCCRGKADKSNNAYDTLRAIAEYHGANINIYTDIYNEYYRR